MIISHNIDFNSVYWFEKINARNAESIAIGIDLMKVPIMSSSISAHPFHSSLAVVRIRDLI